jgi:hypothetical protein
MMIDSVLLYASAALALTGLGMLLRARTRRLGTRALLAGIAGMAIALFWPASEKRAAAATQLDRVMPVWEYDERHEIDVAATPAQVFDAIRNVRADEIRFFNTLTAIRRGGRGGRESILNPSQDAPILDVALRSGFHVMADDSPREIVIGTFVIRPRRAIAAMNFRVVPHGSTSLLITETRVHATDAAARRRFGIYWRIIHPGSDVIRRGWLEAIRRRAESAAAQR